MNNQEAIKWLREAEILDLTCGNTKDREAVNMAISALERQIPKKPKMSLDAYFVCPVCGKKGLEER